MSVRQDLKNRELFEKMPVPSAVGRMVLPTILGQLVVLVYSMADTFFIGRTNNPMMVAGASLILPVYNIALSISGIAGVGGGALISRLMGEYRDEDARKVFAFCIRIAALMALFFSVLTLILMDPLLTLLGAGENTRAYARSYALCVVVAGGIPTVLSVTLSNLVRSVGESGKAGLGVTLGGVINMALDPLFMFVLLPKGQEILGAGIATCLSNCISCVYYLIVLLKLKKAGNKVAGMVPVKDLPAGCEIGKIFSVGVPAAVSTLLFDVDYIIIDRLMSGYGDLALAAIGIVLKVERLPLNIGVGICQGMVPLVAYNYASKDYERMNRISRFALLLGILCATGSICLYEIFAPSVVRFFIADAGTVSLGTGFLRARSLATLFMFMSFYHVNLFNGYGKGGYALLLGVLRWLCFNIPMLFIMNALVGMNGIVWSQLLADILTVTVSLLLHRWFIRNKLGKTAEA